MHPIYKITCTCSTCSHFHQVSAILKQCVVSSQRLVGTCKLSSRPRLIRITTSLKNRSLIWSESGTWCWLDSNLVVSDFRRSFLHLQDISHIHRCTLFPEVLKTPNLHCMCCILRLRHWLRTFSYWVCLFYYKVISQFSHAFKALKQLFFAVYWRRCFSSGHLSQSSE